MRQQKSANSGKSHLLAAGIMIALFLAALFMRRQLLQIVGDHLVRNDPVGEPADLAMLLMGDDTGSRAEQALRLYASHKVLKIAIAEDRSLEFVRMGLQKSDARIHSEFLQARGVPASDIVILAGCNADSTLDEARCLRGMLSRTAAPRQIVVVTSWYHTERAGWLFERILAETGVKVLIAAASSERSHPADWWTRKDDFLAVFNEYLKRLYWLSKQPD